MPPAGVLVAGAVVAMLYLGATAVGHGVRKGFNHVFHKTGKVITQPVRHPKKDAKKLKKIVKPF